MATATTRTEPDAELRFYPTLTRFYGFGPDMLYRMPRAILRLYIEAMPRIRAEELMDAMQAAAYPHMKAADQRSTWRRLQRAVRTKVEPAIIPEDRYEETLAGMGIGVRTVSKAELEAEAVSADA